MVVAQKIDRLRLNKPLGSMPVLQFMRCEDLRIDPLYQRDLHGSASQALIRRIAQHWDWDLCQPLVVARRQDLTERLFVIDGQHRLEAARIRGDIAQLPCVILNYASAAEEAAAFVNLNQQRKPLSRIDVFKAAVLSQTGAAPKIAAAITAAGLQLTGMADSKRWKPGLINNIGGIERAWARYGEAITTRALAALAEGFKGEVLAYAGTIFPGIVAICVNEMRGGLPLEGPSYSCLIAMLSQRAQDDWRRDIMVLRGQDPSLNFATASARVFLIAWERARKSWVERKIAPVPSPTAPLRVAKVAVSVDALAPRWCEQCQQRVSALKAAGCASSFCSLRKGA